MLSACLSHSPGLKWCILRQWLLEIVLIGSLNAEVLPVFCSEFSVRSVTLADYSTLEYICVAIRDSSINLLVVLLYQLPPVTDKFFSMILQTLLSAFRRFLQQ